MNDSNVRMVDPKIHAIAVPRVAGNPCGSIPTYSICGELPAYEPVEFTTTDIRMRTYQATGLATWDKLRAKEKPFKTLTDLRGDVLKAVQDKYDTYVRLCRDVYVGEPPHVKEIPDHRGIRFTASFRLGSETIDFFGEGK